MATITRGSQDQVVEKVRSVLDEYERAHPGAKASVYRHSSAAIRIRIVDEQFENQSKGERHDSAWKFIGGRLTVDEIEDVSMLLLLTPDEMSRSFLNFEFDDPIPSQL
jgi:stress-induced morphogen